MMIISETPSNGTGAAEFFTAIKLICRCEEIPPAEVIVEKAEEYEQFGVRKMLIESKGLEPSARKAKQRKNSPRC